MTFGTIVLHVNTHQLMESGFWSPYFEE